METLTRRPPLVARYRCLRCGCTWEQDAGNAVCPKCGHEWCAWLAYAETGASDGAIVEHGCSTVGRCGVPDFR